MLRILSQRKARMSEAPRYCRNCHEKLGGEYCPRCGQREGRADMRFLDLAGELTGDLLDFDSRLWRTLIYLLFRPGMLTAEFIAGRRARYLPPLRLYLVISFIMFLVMSLGANRIVSVQGDGEAEVPEGVVVGIDLDEAPGEADDPNDVSVSIGLADADSPQWLQDVDQHLEGNVDKLRADPGEFFETLVNYLPQMMFVLLPAFALLLRLVYLLQPFHYLQHLVFSLHYHAFVYLLFLLAQLLELFTVNIDGLLSLGLLVYLPLALHRCYGSSWRGSLGKSLFVYVTYGLLLLLAFSALAILALALL